jgi:hypothetical protein
MTEIKISDEDVAVVGFALCERASLPVCDNLCEDCADDGRAVLGALVASGWRREALTCQENAEHDIGDRDGRRVRTKCSHAACGCRVFRPKEEQEQQR